MNNQILSIVAAVVSIALIEIADAAELITLALWAKCGLRRQLVVPSAYNRRAQGIFRPRRTAT